MPAPDHNKISVTAKLVAYYRQFSDIPLAGEVASAINAQETFNSIVAENNLDPRQLAVLAPILEARYKSIVSRIEKLSATPMPARQVLELASGFSMRGFAMTRRDSISYIDTDLPDLTAEKEKFKAGLENSYSAAAGSMYLNTQANALDFAQLEAAVRPLSRDHNLTVVCEGLVQYFSGEERDCLFQNIYRLIKQFAGGQWISPDFSIKENTDTVSGDRRRMREIVSGLTERQLYQSAFDDFAQMNAYFQKMGFAAQVVSQLEEASHLVSMERLDINASVLEKVRDRLNLWILEPR